MRKIVYWLFFVSMLTACSTVPPPPKPHASKYVVQVVEAITPTPVDLSKAYTSKRIEEILLHPDTVINPYPMLYAEMGKKIVNDRTQMVPMAESFEIINGKTVPKIKEVRLGQALEIKLSEVTEAGLSCSIRLFRQELAGHDRLRLLPGKEVQIPYFKTFNLDAAPIVPPSTWMLLGGFTGAEGDAIICIKITPPAH